MCLRKLDAIHAHKCADISIMAILKKQRNRIKNHYFVIKTHFKSFFDKKLINRKLPNITRFKNNLLKDVDIIFTALPNGEAQVISKKLLKKKSRDLVPFF